MTEQAPRVPLSGTISASSSLAESATREEGKPLEDVYNGTYRHRTGTIYIPIDGEFHKKALQAVAAHVTAKLRAQVEELRESQFTLIKPNEYWTHMPACQILGNGLLKVKTSYLVTFIQEQKNAQLASKEEQLAAQAAKIEMARAALEHCRHFAVDVLEEEDEPNILNLINAALLALSKDKP
jgi:hypothetical protein